MNLRILLIFTMMFTGLSYGASLDCKRPIKKIFTGYTPSQSKIHVEHSDGHGPSIVRLSSVNNDEKNVDRILSVLLAAHMGKREVTFRYVTGVDGNSPNCSSSVSQLTEAVWLE